jgi:hypothetical protein
MIPISYNLRNLAVRKVTTLATALGIGLVVFVLAAVFFAAFLAHLPVLYVGTFSRCTPGVCFHLLIRPPTFCGVLESQKNPIFCPN